MKLDILISEYFLAESALADAMTGDSTPRRRAALLRTCADLLDRIERFQPADAEERKDHIFFFLERAISRPGITADGRDINIALALCQPGADIPVDAPRKSRTAPEESLTGTCGLVHYVRGSSERVSLVDATYRYVATSDANAAFYGTRPSRMVGVHLVDIIGEERFQGRARDRIDACLRGEPQEYYHKVAVENGERIVRCQMKPAVSVDTRHMALVYIRDVTEDLRTVIPPLVR